jgi:hypothetical protein
MSKDLLAIRANAVRGEYDRPRITPYSEQADERPLASSASSIAG